MPRLFDIEPTSGLPIEYGLLAALIAVALIVAIILVQTALQGTFTDVANALTN